MLCRSRSEKIRWTLLAVVLGVLAFFYPQDLLAKKTPKKAETGNYLLPRMPSPALIPGTLPEMNSPGFWIGRHPFPDRTILDEQQIEALNHAIRTDLKISYDLSSYPAVYPGKELLTALNRDLEGISRLQLYRSCGTPVSRTLLSSLKHNMDTGKIPAEIKVGFGFMARSAYMRALPILEGFYRARVKRDFDHLQTSILNIGTPVAVLHASADGRFRYVVAPHGEGWTESSRIVPCSFESLRDYLQKPDFVVVTSAKGDIYLNREMTEFHDRARMGQRFPLIRELDDRVEIGIPSTARGGEAPFISAFIRKREVNRGYLPYTPRTIILQAFEFLNDPYGWGDMHGEPDCSSFIRGVFATVGIELPRNSAFQSRSGRPLGAFERDLSPERKIELLNQYAVGGITLLKMPGHIMLYLGSVDGSPYIIHGLYGYRDCLGKKEVFRVVNRIVITDLNLGKATRIGPFIKRIDTVRTIDQ